MATSLLSQLKEMTTVVADTGDLEAIRRFQPQDRGHRVADHVAKLEGDQADDEDHKKRVEQASDQEGK